MLIVICSIVLLVFAGVKWLTYNIVEKWQAIPVWLNYQPWNCQFCLSFWLNLVVFSVFTYQFTLFFLIGVCLTLLDALAYLIYKKNNTIEIF